MSTCHACSAPIPPVERIGRRDACAVCSADLHCCLNCRFYSPGRHNDCAETQAERVADRTRGNFCEFFARQQLPAGAPGAVGMARAKLDNLFRKRTP